VSKCLHWRPHSRAYRPVIAVEMLAPSICEDVVALGTRNLSTCAHVRQDTPTLKTVCRWEFAATTTLVASQTCVRQTAALVQSATICFLPDKCAYIMRNDLEASIQSSRSRSMQRCWPLCRHTHTRGKVRAAARQAPRHILGLPTVCK
jgi:hypothetical protein